MRPDSIRVFTELSIYPFCPWGLLHLPHPTSALEGHPLKPTNNHRAKWPWLPMFLVREGWSHS